MRSRAYTLIEVLLVLAILAVLSSVVFAALGPAREKARQRTCASNLHQIGLGYAMYIADYDGVEAIQGVAMNPSQLGLPLPGSGVTQLMDKYLKNKEVLKCPSYHGSPPAHYWWPGLAYSKEDDPGVPAVISRRGMNFPLVGCDQHNGALDFQNQPSWATKLILVLRLNQQIQVEHVPAHSNPGDW